MSKKLILKMKNTKSPDEWIKTGAEQEKVVVPKTNKMKRFTIDIPEEWHREIKGDCAKKGVNMVDELRRLIKDRFIK
jgi:hypothetical protein